MYFCKKCGLLFGFNPEKKTAEYFLRFPCSKVVETDEKGNPLRCPECGEKKPEVCDT